LLAALPGGVSSSKNHMFVNGALSENNNFRSYPVQTPSDATLELK